MRRFIVVAVSTLLFATSIASATAEEAAKVSRLQVLAIGAGAIVGVVAANVISGGMITPILMGVGFGMPAEAAAVAAAPVAPAFAAMPAAAANVAAPVVAATSATMAAAHAGIIVVGGAIGAAVGNWLFGTSH